MPADVAELPRLEDVVAATEALLRPHEAPGAGAPPE
jgi:hypothetical protein